MNLFDVLMEMKDVYIYKVEKIYCQCKTEKKKVKKINFYKFIFLKKIK